MPRYRATGYHGNAGRAKSQQARPQLTHFLCIPLVTPISRPQLEGSIVRFKDHISTANRTATAKAFVPLKAIRPIGTIHLTLGVMSLSGNKMEQAVNHLQTLDLGKMLHDARPVPTSTQDEVTEPLSVSLGSLVSMHDPTSTSVLYAVPCDSTARLQSFCDALRLSFVEHDLMLDENRPLKLHATVVNTVYSKAEIGTVKRLDASQILEQLKDFCWSSKFPVEKVTICKMGAKKTYDESGSLLREVYEEIATLDLPLPAKTAHSEQEISLEHPIEF